MSEASPNDLTANTVNGGTFELATPLDLERMPGTPAATPLTKLGPYKIGREIGRGAMGTVYEARHCQLRRTVALKVLPRELAASASRLKRFHREMAAIGRLEHPNIVMATDAGEADGLCYIAMQYIDGQDLEVILEEVGRLDPNDACDIARQAALGLQHIHEQRIVHRDIKPSNIVLSRAGEVKILDLGIAKLRGDGNVDGEDDLTATAAGSLMGTPDYIAPEQISQCSRIDIRADIYSLGCTLYRLLSGTAPFDGPGYTTFTAKLLGHADHDPEPLSELCPEIPGPIVELVQRMMAKEPDDRPATPGEVADELAPFSANVDLLPIANGQRREHLRPRPRTSSAKRTKTENRVSIRSRRLWAGIALCVSLTSVIAFRNRPGMQRSEYDAVTSSTPLAVRSAALTNDETISALTSAVHEIASSNQSIATNTAKIANTLGDVQQQFQQVLARDSILDDPEQPGDYYLNARLHGRRGDQVKARQSYLAYFAVELPVVDPHLEFVRLLKLQEGTSGALETYRDLPGEPDSPQRRLALALLHPGKQRIAILNTLIDEVPEFAPAWYELSREYSETRKPMRSLGDRFREKQLLGTFLELHATGNLLRYFLDQSKAAAMLTDVETRFAALENSPELDRNPVNLILAMPVGDQWKVGFEIAEAAIEIQYRVGQRGEFKSTGSIGQLTGGSGSIDARTGRPHPNPYIELPGDTPRGQIYVRYVDRDEQMRGPFALDFQPEIMRTRWQKQILETTKPHWLQFHNDRLAFALFSTGRASIKSILFGLNEETPTRLKSIPMADINTQNHEEFWINVDSSVHFATAQVTYQDGTRSEIVRFERPTAQE